MDGVITLSSDSENDDSDVEIVGSYSNIMTKTELLPLTAVRVEVGAVTNVNVPTCYIDLTDPRWTLPELKLRKTLNSTALPLVDLTGSNMVNETEQETENFLQDDCQIKEEGTNKIQTSNKQDLNLQKSSLGVPPVFALQPDCCNPESKQICLNSQKQHQKQTDEAHDHPPNVKCSQLSFPETHVAELETLRCSINSTRDHVQIALQPRQPDSNNATQECMSNFTTSNGPHMEPSLDEFPAKVTESHVRQEQQKSSNEFTSPQVNAEIALHLQSSADSPCSNEDISVATLKTNITRNEMEDFCPSIPIVRPTSPSSSYSKALSSFQSEVCRSDPEQPEVDQGDSRQSFLSNCLSPYFPHKGLNPSHNLMIGYDPTLTPEHTHATIMSEWQPDKVQTDEAMSTSDLLRSSIPSKSPLSVSKTEDVNDGSGTYRGDLGIESPVPFLWQQGSDGEQGDESRFDMDFRAVSREERHFVCPVRLRKIMSGPAQALIDEEDEGFGAPEMLCRQSLSLVYSTIDENYSEGTLQLLSDLLQPGYYPPKDITLHLLRGILLDPQCPFHLCVQAFNLLIRTQRLKQPSNCRHHMADKTTVPWDWELLTSVMAKQDQTKRYRCEIVRMLLEYVVQTLEDDFQAKHSTSALHQSLAKATLSCDQQFPHVRDVIKWLFSAIMKSTELGESREAAKDRDEQIRMVSIFQRMLSLALEADRSPALNSAKLSQELFHMLIGSIPLRAHRMLLLESLQSKLLRCKLLEHLLDYACPLKISLPMSLSLLLHFMKNCTLAPDPTDGNERWQRWEELVHLLWMLLLSYNKAMKGYLCSSVTEQKGRVGTLVYKQDDKITKPAVLEAVEAFLSRSKADLGQALPLHVEESLTYLQDHLLDVCQC